MCSSNEGEIFSDAIVPSSCHNTRSYLVFVEELVELFRWQEVADVVTTPLHHLQSLVIIIIIIIIIVITSVCFSASVWVLAISASLACNKVIFITFRTPMLSRGG